jgi:RNA-directed DNA polymerase
LSSRLYQNRYRPAPPRWIDVPKGDGRGTRRLGILTVEDRVVHAAWKQVLEPILEPGFVDNSFGFRPGRSVAGALDVAVKKLSGGGGGAPLPFAYVCKLDVADCFDTIDHGRLIQQLRAVVADDAALALIERMLASGGQPRGWWSRRMAGVVQGSSLSPLLCNFYLDPLDQALAAYSERTGGGVQLLRYADDLLLLARNRRLALGGLRVVQRTLAGLRQRLKRDKTRVVPVREGVEWLGVLIRPRAQSFGGRIEFGYEVPAAKVAAMLARIDEITAPPSTRIDPSAFDLGRWLASINDQLRDWWQAYVYAENAPAVFRKLDDHSFQRVGQLLTAVTGRGVGSCTTATSGDCLADSAPGRSTARS